MDEKKLSEWFWDFDFFINCDRTKELTKEEFMYGVRDHMDRFQRLWS